MSHDGAPVFSPADVALARALAVMLAYLDETQPWRLDALCREPHYDAELFFPTRGFPIQIARSICARCPVSVECAQYGEREDIGVWGGTSVREREHARLAG